MVFFLCLNASRYADSELIFWRIGIHRIGDLQISDKIVLVIAASPHRSDCIQACEYIIDALKANVALWKFNTKENEKKPVEQKKKDMDKYLTWNEVIN